MGTVGADIPVWISVSQFTFWKQTQVTIDVVPGRGAGFSLEGPEGGALYRPQPRVHRR